MLVVDKNDTGIDIETYRASLNQIGTIISYFTRISMPYPCKIGKKRVYFFKKKKKQH
tara:strand:+ start:3585 stop:3755 length:171 start_codon:yes stop_codon:yes gene_type:complete